MPVEWCRDQSGLGSFHDVGLFPWSTAIFIRGVRPLPHWEYRGLPSIIKVVYDCFSSAFTFYLWPPGSWILIWGMPYSSFLMKTAYDAIMSIGSFNQRQVSPAQILPSERQCRHQMGLNQLRYCECTIQYSTQHSCSRIKNLEESQTRHIRTRWARCNLPTQNCITMIC